MRARRKDFSAPKTAVDWLLEEDQPSIRYRALTRLLDRPEDDGEVRSARESISKVGWAADILARQDPEGWWVGGESLYRPKYLSTNWMLLVLADLGLTREDPRIAAACELWIRRFSKADGGFAMDGSKASHLCTTGNMARALAQFGYADHPKVRSAFEWLGEYADPKGGWNCFGSGRNLDSWEALSAFAVYPRAKWTAGMERAVELGAGFYMERELHRQGARYEPWYRFHDPVHYYYDVLVGLDLLTALGYADDPRLRFAISHLKKKRRPDGRWNLDAVHPDVEGATGEWYAKHPSRAPTPFALETPGRPSKVITLRAMLVLRRLDGLVAMKNDRRGRGSTPISTRGKRDQVKQSGRRVHTGVRPDIKRKHARDILDSSWPGDTVPTPTEPEATTQTDRTSTTQWVQVETDERLFRDLMERFSVLAETCSRFSREVYRRTRTPPDMDPEEALKASLAITRTVFNPWSLEILATMYLRKSVRLKDLREAMGRGSDETLMAHLSALDLYGLVQREVAAEAPSRARYSLTHKGLMIAQLGEPLFLYLRLAHGWSNREWDDIASSIDPGLVRIEPEDPDQSSSE